VYKGPYESVTAMSDSRNRKKAASRGPGGDNRQQRFMVGKYEVVADSLHGSAHMRRYSVFFEGRRIGAQVSMPSESDCRFLEKPPPVPPLKSFQAIYRPGRPKKNAVPVATPLPVERGHVIPREDLPAGVPSGGHAKSEDS
jgi:hypothetical protein